MEEDESCRSCCCTVIRVKYLDLQVYVMVIHGHWGTTLCSTCCFSGWLAQLREALMTSSCFRCTWCRHYLFLL